MKHSYTGGCGCGRCAREQARRQAQGVRQGAIGSRARAQARRPVRAAAIDRWARAYADTEGGIDQFNPEDR